MCCSLCIVGCSSIGAVRSVMFAFLLCVARCLLSVGCSLVVDVCCVLLFVVVCCCVLCVVCWLLFAV